ncbi:photosystem II reaction center phosphoprotein PsbH [Kovacikia minuta]
MQQQKFQPKNVAPIQYLLRNLNSSAGRVTPGWGTTPLMAILMLLFFVFLLIILQVYNASILLEGVNVDWSALNNVPAISDPPPSPEGNFAATATKIFFGLLVFTAGCVAFIRYGAITYPKDQA